MLLIYFIFGSIFASFILVVALRLPENQDFLISRSCCDHCQHLLAWYDLIPVISYLTLGGSCRYCRKQISIINPLFEVFGGLCLVGSSMLYDNLCLSLVTCLLILVLMGLSIIDIDYMMIPDSLIIVVILFAVILMFCEEAAVMSHMTAMIFPLGLILINIIVPESFGEGDIMLLCPLCLLLGFKQSFVFVLLSSLCGSTISLYKLLKGEPIKNVYAPFVPMLTIGFVLTIFIF